MHRYVCISHRDNNWPPVSNFEDSCITLLATCCLRDRRRLNRYHLASHNVVPAGMVHVAGKDIYYSLRKSRWISYNDRNNRATPICRTGKMRRTGCFGCLRFCHAHETLQVGAHLLCHRAESATTCVAAKISRTARKQPTLHRKHLGIITNQHSRRSRQATRLRKGFEFHD
jgi:hypothetical protein